MQPSNDSKVTKKNRTSSSSSSSSDSSRASSHKNEKSRLEDNLRREEAANKYLDFLENEDRGDLEQRAKSRGESVENHKELYVVKEEMTIPSDYQKGILKIIVKIISNLKYNYQRFMWNDRNRIRKLGNH